MEISMVLKGLECYQHLSYLFSLIFLRFLGRPFLSYFDFEVRLLYILKARGIQAIDR